MRRHELFAAASLVAGGALVLGLAGERIALQDLAAGLAVCFAALTGMAKQAAP